MTTKLRTKVHNSYRGMKNRCCNKNDKCYSDYGGRGIKICQEWLASFDTFYNWAMKNNYQEGLSIDRIDVNGNYEPSNCRWITQKQQCNNTRRNVYLTYKGKTQTMKQWAEELNISYGNISKRHYRGWSDIECLFGK